ncbi:MAG TPA: TetR/AcrR family transcriptional regulator C-terminal domain-containing protein [Actinophytocola sp.]|uniref:TetR/AcrR family transcriptional regulator n=1 Tax=Actinophytocola sp. TaxID=1872138 RepID=UPI002F95A5B4
MGARGPQPRLSVEQVVTAAIEVLDAGEQVSVRAVAGRLDVRPNTIYTYLPDKSALDSAVADRLLEMAGLDLLAGRRAWRRRIADYAVALRTVLLERPGAISLFHSAPMNGAAALTVGERLLDAFGHAGLCDEDSSRASYAVMTYVLGAIALSDADAGTEPERAARLAAVPAAAFPRIARTAPVAATWNGEKQFRWGLDQLLDGLVSR